MSSPAAPGLEFRNALLFGKICRYLINLPLEMLQLTLTSADDLDGVDNARQFRA
jgi:hypothetical protein